MNEIPKSWLIGAGIGTAVLVALFLIGRKTGQKLAAGLDVTSSDNWIASAVDKAGAAVTNESDFSLGVWAWRLFNSDEEKKSAQVGAGPEYAAGSKKKAASSSKPAAKTGPTQGGSWSVTAPTDDRPPSVLNPGQGGTGGSFEQQSQPWSY